MAFKLHLLPHVEQRIEAAKKAYAVATPFRYTEPEKYTGLLNEFYKEETIRRIQNYQKLKEEPKRRRQVLELMCMRENLVNTMVDWIWTYDPRLAQAGLPTTLPWIPWYQQIEFIEWVYDLYMGSKNGIAEKSRDCGATWLMCLIYIQEWRWIKGFAGGFGSNKIDKVDKKGDPDSIFEKIRSLLLNMPSWWFPRGWMETKHNKFCNLINPENGSNIAGDGGRQIGRGGRRSVYTVDEKASLDFPEEADNALSQTTNCQIDISTPIGMNHFGQARWSGRLPVFSFTWKKDFRKDETWYKHEKDRLRPEVVAQEIDCDYHASVEGIFIKPEWVQAAMDIKLTGEGICSAGLDVAAGGKNDSALAIRVGPVVKIKRWNIDNAIDLVHGVIDICNDTHVSYLHYDKPGVGFAVKSTIDRTERKMEFLCYGWEPAGSVSDKFYDEFDAYAKDIFVNPRAEAWYNLALRFEKTWQHVHKIREYPHHELISIDRDGQLMAEFTAPKKKYTESGKIKVESKEDMLKRGIESPDSADATVLAFLEKGSGHKHVVENYNPLSSTHESFTIDWGKTPKHRCLHYGAISLEKDMSVHVLCAIWNEVKGHLYIYDELVHPTPDPHTVVPTIVKKMRLNEYGLDKFLGNDDMFREGKRTVAKELNKVFWDQCSRFQTVKIRQASKYDPYGSMTILNNMVEKKLITIHIKCKETNKQLLSWRLENGRVVESGMRTSLLLIVSELVKNVPLKEIFKSLEYVTRLGSPEKPKRFEKLLVEDAKTTEVKK